MDFWNKCQKREEKEEDCFSHGFDCLSEFRKLLDMELVSTKSAETRVRRSNISVINLIVMHKYGLMAQEERKKEEH